MFGAISKEIQELSECLTPMERRAIIGEDDGRMARPMSVVLPGGMKDVGVQPTQPAVNPPNPRMPAKYSDSELVFVFENEVEAQALFDMAVFDLGLLPGEIILHKDDETGRCAVSIMPLVYITHPEIVYAIIMTYHRHTRIEKGRNTSEDIARDLEGMFTGRELKVWGPRKGATQVRLFFEKRKQIGEVTVTGKRIRRFDEDKFKAIQQMVRILRKGTKARIEESKRASVRFQSMNASPVRS